MGRARHSEYLCCKAVILSLSPPKMHIYSFHHVTYAGIGSIHHLLRPALDRRRQYSINARSHTATARNKAIINKVIDMAIVSLAIINLLAMHSSAARISAYDENFWVPYCVLLSLLYVCDETGLDVPYPNVDATEGTELGKSFVEDFLLHFGKSKPFPSFGLRNA